MLAASFNCFVDKEVELNSRQIKKFRVEQTQKRDDYRNGTPLLLVLEPERGKLLLFSKN